MSHGLWAYLKCDNCQKSFLRKRCVKVVLSRKHHYCCGDCAKKSPFTKEKARKTSYKNYGVSHPMKSAIFVEYMKDCCNKLYGVNHPRKSKTIIQKIRENSKQTFLNRYGVESAFHLSDIQAKCRSTCKNTYGFEFAIQNSNIFKKYSKSRKHTQKILHWKTGELLVCTAKYEVAFVDWCTYHRVDFDWQIKVKTELKTDKGNQSFYFIDAYIKDGQFANTWIEIKGFLTGFGEQKWEWFHSQYPNSQLWNTKVLEELQILIKGKPNVLYQNSATRV